MTPNLRTLGIVEVAAAAASFALGVIVGLAGLLLFVSEDGDVGLLGGRVGVGLLLAIPLAIAPIIYLAGFMFQETRLANRSRRAQLTSAAVSGLAYVLLLRAIVALADWIGAELDDPVWLYPALVMPVWLLGPLLVALVSLWVERRMETKEARDAGSAG